MNRSISDTNVVQDLALSLNTWLIPSNMIILKSPIPGYNNLLKTAIKTMKFCVNSKVNYAAPRDPPKKTHQDHQDLASHFDTLQVKPAVKPEAKLAVKFVAMYGSQA